MCGDVEFVEDDARLWQMIGHPADEGRRHVDAHGGDLIGPRFVRSQVFGKGGDGRGSRPSVTNTILRSAASAAMVKIVVAAPRVEPVG